jgi:hypothetical protein
MLSIHLHELLNDDPAELIGTRGQTTEAIVDLAIDVMPLATAAFTASVRVRRASWFTLAGRLNATSP